ncbi:MAG: hypothetical protein CML66_28430 [Rhodobacteraceae bacterium]|nr:hypothetical protein [Paracoccaceae bacterium]
MSVIQDQQNRTRAGHVAKGPLRVDSDLLLTHYPGQTDTLVVTFNSAGHGLWTDQPDEFIGMARGADGHHVIAVSDLRRSWYSAPGLQERVVEDIRDFADANGIARIAMLGSSMGGYGALSFAERVGAQAAMGIVPQFSMHPRFNEPRWSELRPGMVEKRLGTLGSYLTGQTRAFCLTGAKDRHDRRHYNMITRRCPVQGYLLKDCGHDLALQLKTMGHLPRLVAAMIAGEDEVFDTILSPLVQRETAASAAESGED